MEPEAAGTVRRWLYLWIAIGVVVVLVVIGFLFGIASSLEHIDDDLTEASHAVGSVRGDTEPLPAHIERVNAALQRIDDALKPLPREASAVIDNLGSIDRTLGDVEGSLRSTSGLLIDSEGKLRTISASLSDTSGLLVDSEGRLRTISGRLVDVDGTLRATEATLRTTSGDLVTVLVLARRIDDRLALAQIPESNGTNAIWRHVRVLNGGRFYEHAQRHHGNLHHRTKENKRGLDTVKRDAGDIVAGLGHVDQHLESICRAPAGVAPPPAPTPTPVPLVSAPAPGGITPTPPC